jgi:hypothetical protein
MEVVSMVRRILPSPRSEAKKKTNTFYRINPATPLYPYIYGMLKIYREEPDRYSSQLVDKPLDHLCDLAGKSSAGDHMTGRELEVARELIAEVFSVGNDEVKRMIKERMARKGMIKDRDRRKDLPENGSEWPKKELKPSTGKTRKTSRKRAKVDSDPEEGAE